MGFFFNDAGISIFRKEGINGEGPKKDGKDKENK